MTRRQAGALALLLAAAAVGCAPGLREARVQPAMQERSFEIGKIAVATFQAGSAYARGDDQLAVPIDAGAVVAHQVAEALRARGLDVVAPEDVRGAADPAAEATDVIDPARVLVVAQDFGANAVLTGKVVRWRDRQGEAFGASQTASVGFQVTLLRVPDGAKLWTAVFDETQQPLTDNLFNAFRYPGGGTRWLTAEEMSRWGAEEVAAALPTAS